MLPASALGAQAQNVAEIQVTPETMTLGVGQKQALFAAAFDARGNLIAAAKFTFWSSDTMIARVRKDGTVLGVSPGLAKIEARSQGSRASMAVLITGSAPPDPAGGRAGTASVLTLEPASVTLYPGEKRPDHRSGGAGRRIAGGSGTGDLEVASSRRSPRSIAAGIVTGLSPRPHGDSGFHQHPAAGDPVGRGFPAGLRPVSQQPHARTD